MLRNLPRPGSRLRGVCVPKTMLSEARRAGTHRIVSGTGSGGNRRVSQEDGQRRGAAHLPTARGHGRVSICLDQGADEAAEVPIVRTRQGQPGDAVGVSGVQRDDLDSRYAPGNPGSARGSLAWHAVPECDEHPLKRRFNLSSSPRLNRSKGGSHAVLFLLFYSAPGRPIRKRRFQGSFKQFFTASEGVGGFPIFARILTGADSAVIPVQPHALITNFLSKLLRKLYPLAA